MEGRTVRATLEVEGTSARGDALARMMRETADIVFEADPEAAEVEVLSRTGAVLGRILREREPHPPVAIDPALHEPRIRHRPGPDLSRHPMREEYGEPTDRGDQVPVRRAYDQGDGIDGAPEEFAGSLDLPRAVLERLGDDRDATEVVRAILEAAGHTVGRREGLLVAGDVALCVLQPGHSNVIDDEQLSAAYLRLHESHTSRGFVVCPGVVDLDDIRRRELLAPAVRHIGPEDLQRMADAVVLGGDPLGFTVGPDLRVVGAA
jgi:hypothetical protein